MPIPENIIDIKSPQQLDETLLARGISTETWGAHDTKTSADLYEELRAGESVLFLAANGLQKYIWTVKVDVYYSEGSRLDRLVEAVQYNRVTGSWRHRGQFNSISEKRRAMHGEAPVAAALRALGEEIQVTEPHSLHLTSDKVWPAKPERNYAGIQAVNETHYFAAQLRPQDFDPRGYTEEQQDRITYFYWENLKP